MAGGSVMKRYKSMTTLVEDYLVARRALGVKLTVEGRQLCNFAQFADEVAHGGHLTVDLALRWACSSKRSSQVGQARRLEVIRPFARYLSAIDPRTEIPPKGILGSGHPRIPPKIYSDCEVRDLLAAAAQLKPEGGLRPKTIHTYLSLLVCTGMRPGEPLRLTNTDVNLKVDTITVRETKFRKSRIVTLHPSATEALLAYVRFRDSLAPNPKSPAFFLVDGGTALTSTKLCTAFDRLRRELGWVTKSKGRTPRLYDFRHAFVCRRLLLWYAQKVDVHNVMPALSTYLGHVKVTDTYWYLTGIPELMELASSRFERFAIPEKGELI